ncbi:hypothetical protein [Bradyrhizobium sp. ORS 86]|uniref:hypothetical protein n=1 Tax=Bradyrhizobium sp. ORS 86 TaxID=1685970 RepID=UPI00388E778D
MFARKGVFSSIGRAATLATVAVVALTAIEPTMAFAGSAAAGKATAMATSHGTSEVTDISARRRYYRGGGAAAAAAFAGIVGTTLAIIAAQNRYDSYAFYSGPGYYGGPAYYGGPVYYGGGPYYGYRGYYGRRSQLPYVPY